MVLSRALSAGAVMSLALAGCGGGNATSTATTSVPATAKTSTPGMAGHVLANNELNGFKGTQPPVANTVHGWLTATQTPPDQLASETKRLTGLGFVAGAHKDLVGPDGRDGVSIVEQFKTPDGARSELADSVRLFKANAQGGAKTFPVPGIPGAVGLVPIGTPAVNVAFASGDYYYLVGAFVPKVSASSEATVSAAAKHLYQRLV
jgi:hypothetical protein